MSELEQGEIDPDEVDLSSLGDDDLVTQMHDDLDDGLAAVAAETAQRPVSERRLRMAAPTPVPT